MAEQQRDRGFRVEVPAGARSRIALHGGWQRLAGRRAGHAHGPQPRQGVGRRSRAHRVHGIGDRVSGLSRWSASFRGGEAD